MQCFFFFYCFKQLGSFLAINVHLESRPKSPSPCLLLIYHRTLMLFPIKSHLLKAYRSRLERRASMENETSSAVENDSPLMSSYEVLCVGENASWQEYVLQSLECWRKKSLPQSITAFSVQWLNETLRGKYTDASKALFGSSRVSVKYGVKTSW